MTEHGLPVTAEAARRYLREYFPAARTIRLRRSHGYTRFDIATGTRCYRLYLADMLLAGSREEMTATLRAHAVAWRLADAGHLLLDGRGARVLAPDGSAGVGLAVSRTGGTRGSKGSRRSRQRRSRRAASRR